MKKSGTRKPNGTNVTNYLLSYNAIQAVGWGYILCVTLAHLLSNGGSGIGLWARIGCPLQIFQTLAVLEVIHAASGIVASGIAVTTLQLLSRLFVVWGILWSVPQIGDSFAVPLIALAWGPTEIIRYSYYFLNILHKVPSFLVWCRYSLFMVLYPLGVVGEMSSIFTALPHIKSSELYYFSMPNCFNVSFNYAYFTYGVASTFIPFFPMLYLHMFSQRKKVLSPKTKSQ